MDEEGDKGKEEGQEQKEERGWEEQKGQKKEEGERVSRRRRWGSWKKRKMRMRRRKRRRRKKRVRRRMMRGDRGRIRGRKGEEGQDATQNEDFKNADREVFVYLVTSSILCLSLEMRTSNVFQATQCVVRFTARQVAEHARLHPTEHELAVEVQSTAAAVVLAMIHGLDRSQQARAVLLTSCAHGPTSIDGTKLLPVQLSVMGAHHRITCCKTLTCHLQ